MTTNNSPIGAAISLETATFSKRRVQALPLGVVGGMEFFAVEGEWENPELYSVCLLHGGQLHPMTTREAWEDGSFQDRLEPEEKIRGFLDSFLS